MSVEIEEASADPVSNGEEDISPVGDDAAMEKQLSNLDFGSGFDPKIIVALEDNIRSASVDYLEFSNALRGALDSISEASVEQMEKFRSYAEEQLQSIEEVIKRAESFDKGFRDVDKLNEEISGQITQIKTVRDAVDRLETVVRQVCRN